MVLLLLLLLLFFDALLYRLIAGEMAMKPPGMPAVNVLPSTVTAAVRVCDVHRSLGSRGRMALHALWQACQQTSSYGTLSPPLLYLAPLLSLFAGCAGGGA
jgi:hypothetical protein